MDAPYPSVSHFPHGNTSAAFRCGVVAARDEGATVYYCSGVWLTPADCLKPILRQRFPKGFSVRVPQGLTVFLKIIALCGFYSGTCIKNGYTVCYLYSGADIVTDQHNSAGCVG